MATTKKTTPKSQAPQRARMSKLAVDQDKHVIDEAFTPEASPATAEFPSAAVSLKRSLEERDDVEAVLRDRFRDRAKDAAAITKMADQAFAMFRPSRFTEGERLRGIYLPSGEDLGADQARAKFDEAMDKAQSQGVGRLKATQDNRKLRLELSDELRNDPNLKREGSLDGGNLTFELGPFADMVHSKLNERPPLRNEPAVTQCQAEAQAVELLGRAGTGHASEPGAGPGEVGSGDGQSSNGTGSHVPTRAFVNDLVSGLMSTVTSPEEKLLVNLDPQRATLANTEKAVDTFQLRAGASDVTSYHDFRSLHLAFEHVWTELFNDELTEFGRRLYAEAVKLEQFCLPGQPTRIDPTLTSIADIKRLMSRVAELSSIVDQDVNPTQTGFMNPALTGFTNPTQTVYTKQGDAEAEYQESIRIADATRLSLLLQGIASRIQGNYAFKVFAENSWNFGFMVTYRQTWTPQSYQVGDLVSTLPLTPRETRRYTTKRVVKKTRAVKEVEDSLRTTKSESSGTSRVEREIVDKAQEKSNFDATAQGSLGSEGAYKTDYTVKAGGEAGAQSERVKKAFHDSVLRSAEEYKQQHRIEIDTTANDETEETTFHEIQNPNDELTVTYMFYELQRRYQVSERIYQLTPVILLANKVPAPHEIDDAWLTEYDWILRRVILDDSFRPALEYLTKSFVGAELNIKILETNARAQKQVADEIKDQLKAQVALLKKASDDLETATKVQAGNTMVGGFLATIKHVFDPLQITGKEVTGTGEGVQSLVDYAQEYFDRAERERSRLMDQLAAATNVLQLAIDKLSAAVKEHNERVSEIDRLRVHVKDNITYYMQAIWSHEPPDQRFFRVFDKQISVPVTDDGKVQVAARALDVMDKFAVSWDTYPYEATMPVDLKAVAYKQMSEIADLDQVLGYKGNYAIYPLLENNFITLNMMLDYLEVSDEVVKLRDPDTLGDYTVAEILALADCVKRNSPETFKDHAKEFKDLVVKRLLSGHGEDGVVIVPTDSLYVEALVGTHPLLEDFKLLHRSLDVKKVQAEVRHAELENIRLAARALKGNVEDPDIEKTVIVEGGDGKMLIGAD